MADPQRTYYPGPGALAAVDVGPRLHQTHFSAYRVGAAAPRLHIETGTCSLSFPCSEGELVTLRDMLSAVIADAPAAAIPVGEATDSDHAALDAIGSSA